jgi:DNA polymerase
MDRQQYLDAMGIQTWTQRGKVISPDATQAIDAQRSLENIVVESTAPLSAPAMKTESSGGLQSPPGDTVSSYNWPQLKGAVAQCIACELHEKRKNTVFGVGDEQADWMVIGEAPGAEEDRQGEPFVGNAGQLLNNMLLAVGLKREQVYIANILKCRPPNNRDPRPEEVLKCEPFLRRQVELVNPKIILAVGRIAAHNLLKTDISLSKLRGKCYFYGENETPLIVTYHPAYLLRSPSEKRKAWQDLLFAQSISREQS